MPDLFQRECSVRIVLLIDDNETGGLSFEIQKDRFSFRLLPPCSDERKEKARACAEALNQSRKEL